MNRYSYVRIIESTPERVVIHWRDMPRVSPRTGFLTPSDTGPAGTCGGRMFVDLGMLILELTRSGTQDTVWPSPNRPFEHDPFRQ